MFQRMTNSNEIIGLTMMLLLVMALVASQAAATAESDSMVTAIERIESPDVPDMPFTATIEGHFNGKVLTLSIDNMAHFGQFRVYRD